MRDPHVIDLTYRLVTDPTITYNNPPPVAFDTPLASFTLADGTLTATLKEHFASAHAARRAIEAVLDAWSLRTQIKSGDGRLAFQYEQSNVIDRLPPEPGAPQVIALEGIASGFAMGDIPALHLTCPKYPDPPTDFVRTPDVDALSARWLDNRAGREPLMSVAYLIASFLKTHFKGYERAAEALNISQNVLAKLHTISSHYGDERSARKIVPNPRPLLPGHIGWIEDLIPRIILRLAQLPIEQPPTPLTMVDLPTLPAEPSP